MVDILRHTLLPHKIPQRARIGLTLDKMLMLGAPDTLPITIEYTRGCFLNKRIRKWNFGYNKNIPLEEILQVNKAISVYLQLYF